MKHPSITETILSLETRLKLYQAILEILESSHRNRASCTICNTLKFILHDLLMSEGVDSFPEIVKYKPKKAFLKKPWWPLRNMVRRIDVMRNVIRDTEKKIKVK